MWSGTRPTSPPLLTYPQLAAQLRIDDFDEQTYIMDLLDAATEYAEQALDSSLLTRTITATYYTSQTFDMYPGLFWGYEKRLVLPRGPVSAIQSITDADANNITQYQLQRHGFTDEVSIRQTYTAPLTIVYTAGYGDTAADVPADIRLALRTHVASLWRTRESISDRQMIPTPQSLADFYARRNRTAPVA